MLISVIITAYNRQEFLADAVKSVLNQDFDRKNYEIIVIKNYKNYDMDKFLESNNVINIIMDGTIGEFLYKGISISHGDIISFLDDDDMFDPEKLYVISQEFTKGCKYLHNSQKLFTSKKTDVKRYNTKNLSFNLSSITITRELIHTELLKNITTGIDNFVFYCALSQNAKLCFTDLNLTLYRIHNSMSIKFSQDIQKFKKIQYRVSESIYNQLVEYTKMFPSISSIIRNDAVLNKFLMRIYHNNVKIGFNNYLHFFFSFIYGRKHSYEYKIGILYMIISLSPAKIKNAFIMKAYNRNKDL